MHVVWVIITYELSTCFYIWFRYVHDTWVKIQTQEVEAFTEHINLVDSNIKFTREDAKDQKLPFLDCVVHIEEDGSLNTEVYRKPTHTDHYLLFVSHHPREHKPSTLNWKKHIWTEEVVSGITCPVPTMQHSLSSPNCFTTIHTLDPVTKTFLDR